MIWFTCQECGRKHGRPETSAGALTFCSCGHGNTVPWESTTEPDPIVVAEKLPDVPLLAPLKFEPERSSGPPAPPVRLRPPPLDRPGRRDERRLRSRPRDPNVCLNHVRRASQAACVDCKDGFCADCLVYVDAKPLCGPCKNRRVKTLHEPPPTSQLALMSVLLALFTGPLAFCLYPMGLNFQTQKLVIFALVPQCVALALGIWALRKIATTARLGGQAMALSGILTACFGVFWTVFLTLYAPRLWG